MNKSQKNILSLRAVLHVFLTLMLLAPALCLRPSTVARAGTNFEYVVDILYDGADEIPGDGDCDIIGPDVLCSLRAAIESANAAHGRDTVILGPGTYDLTITGSGEDAGATGDLDITEDLTITGAGASETIILADNSDRVFHILGDADVTISGVTIMGGETDGDGTDDEGGGVYNEGTLLLERCVVADNVATNGNGGGIYNAGSLTLSDSTISGNQSLGDNGGIRGGGVGGGIYNVGTLKIADSTISANQALGGDGQDGQVNGGGGGGGGGGLGGGICNDEGTLTITNSTLSHNQAIGGDGGDGAARSGNPPYGNGGNGGGYGGAGGGVIAETGQFGGNGIDLGGAGGGGGSGLVGGIGGNGHAGGGGGGCGGGASSSNPGFAGYGGGAGGPCDVSTGGGGGGGGGLGGAIFMRGWYTGTIVITNSVIYLNQAIGGQAGTGSTDAQDGQALGGGLLLYGGSITLTNSIIVSNTADLAAEDCDNILGLGFTSLGNNLVGAGTGCPSDGSGDQEITDARLGPLADNGGETYTHALLPGSPAVEAANDAACPATDQRGVARPQGDHCDIGAYEAAASLSVSKSVSDEEPSLGDVITYTVVVTNSSALTATHGSISDVIPSGLTFVGPVTLEPPGAGITGTAPLLVDVLTVPVESVVTATYAVSVDLNQEHGTVIENTAFVGSEDLSAPATDAISITLQAPVLSLTKTADDLTPQVGGQFNYSIVVENGGGQSASGASVSDPLHPALSLAGPVVIEPSGAGMVGTAPPTLASGLTITAGESITLSFPVTLNTSWTGGTPQVDILDGTTLSNTAQVTCTQILTPAVDSEEITARAPLLSVSKSVDVPSPSPNDTITYTIVVENSGTGDANNLVISDTLEDGLTFVAGSAVVAFSDGSTLALPGGSPPTLAESLFIGAGDTITLSFKASVDADQLDGTLIDNLVAVTSDEVSTPVTAAQAISVGYPILSLTKTVDDDTPAMEQVIVYTVVVANSGSHDATDAVISDTLDEGLTFTGPITLQPPDAGLTGTLPTLVHSLTIPAYESVTVTFGARVNSGLDIGTVISNVASVSSDEVTTPVSNQDAPTLVVIEDLLPPFFPSGETVLITPTQGIDVLTLRPLFDWLDADDDSMVVSYTLILTGTTVYNFAAYESTYTPVEDLPLGRYTWTVVAHDLAGNTSDPVSPAETFSIRTLLFLPLVMSFL